MLLMLAGPPASGLSVLFTSLSITGIKPIAGSENTDQLSAESIDRLLFQELDISPNMVGGLPENWINTQAAKKTRDRIRNLLSRYLLKSGIGMITGSTLCRTLPIWIEVCEELNIEPRVIVMIRHPWEVAQSLAAIKNIELVDGHLLWLSYIRDAMRVCQNRRHTLVTYDQLVADPVTTLFRIGDELSLSWPINPWSVKTELLNLVQPDLKHCHAADLSNMDQQRYCAYEQFYRKIRFEQPGFSATASIESDLIDSLLASIGQYEKPAGTGNKQQKRIADHVDTEFYAQVLFPSSKKSGEVVETIPLIADEWQKISLIVPEPALLQNNPLILRPLNTSGTVLISNIKLTNRATGELVREFSSAHDFDSIEIQRDTIRLPNRKNLLLSVFGPNPKVCITKIHEVRDMPLDVEIWIRIIRDQDKLYQFYNYKKPEKTGNSPELNQQLLNKLRIMTSVWGFQQEFKARSLNFQKISTDNPQSLIKVNTFWNADIHLLPQNEVVSSSIYSYGFFEPELCCFLIDYLFNNAVFLDIGAHIGLFSMLAAELVGEKGHVFTFEPTPSTRNVLELNVSKYPQVQIIPKLAWSSTTLLDFNDYGIQFSAFNTAVSNRLNTEQKKLAKENLIKVEGIDIDSFCREQGIKPDLIKIDAESSEMQVLQGMTGLLETIRPVVTIEVGDMENTVKDYVPRSRDVLKFAMGFDYLPLNSIGGRYQYHELKNEYTYDNIIMAPVEKLPVRRPIGAVAVNQGNFY